jgi:hypothetical protein
MTLLAFFVMLPSSVSWRRFNCPLCRGGHSGTALTRPMKRAMIWTLGDFKVGVSAGMEVFNNTSMVPVFVVQNEH